MPSKHPGGPFSRPLSAGTLTHLTAETPASGQPFPNADTHPKNAIRACEMLSEGT